MIRWASCGLLVAVASVASAQTADVISEVSGLSVQPARLRPNPFGGAPVPQVALPGVGQQFAQLKAQPAPPAAPLLPGTVEGPPPSSGGPRPVSPVFALPGAPKLDRHGDPLPAGAVARFGSLRLRHGADVLAMAFTHDTKLLCTVSATDDSVRMWDVVTGKEAARLRTPVQLIGLARDGSVLIVDGTRIKAWFPATKTVRELPEKTLPEGSSPSALAVNPDGRSFALATNGKILLIDILTGKTIRELNLPVVPQPVVPGGAVPAPVPPAPPPVGLLYSPDGRWLLGHGQKTGVWLWDLRTGKRVRTYHTEAEYPEYTFSPDVTRIAITGERVDLYPLDSEEPVDGFKGPTDAAYFAPRFADDGKTLFVVEQDIGVLSLDAATGEAKAGLDSPDAEFRRPFVLAPGGARAAAIDQTGGIRIWDPKTGKEPELARLTPLSNPGSADGGKSVTVIDQTGTVRGFDLATGAPGPVIELPLGVDNSPATWDPAFRRAATVILAKGQVEVRVIAADTKQVVSKHSLPQGSGIPVIAFAAANRDRLAVFSQTGVTVLNPTTGKTVRSFAPSGAENGTHGAISPDGRLVAAAGQPLSVWEVATGKKRLTVDAVPNADLIAFAPDSRQLAVWDQGGTVAVVDVRSGAVTRRFPVADVGDGVSALAFSPDGKRVAVGTSFGRVTVWNVSTGETLAPLAGHEGTVTGLVFTVDGKKLVSTSMDGTALVWEVPDAPLPTGQVEDTVIGFDEAFKLLGSNDPAQAQRGLDYLYRNPAEAVKQIGARMPVPAPVPVTKLAQYVADLESDEFSVREAAVKALAETGGEAGTLLKQAVEKSSSAEVRKLAGELLVRIEAPAVRSGDLQVLRAVEALEYLGTLLAREQLEKWAAGPAGRRTTVEAVAALSRLKALDGK